MTPNALTLESLRPGKYPITSSMCRATAFMRYLARACKSDYRRVRKP